VLPLQDLTLYSAIVLLLLLLLLSLLLLLLYISLFWCVCRW